MRRTTQTRFAFAVALLLAGNATADDTNSGGGWTAVGTSTNFGVVGGAFLATESTAGPVTNVSGLVGSLFAGVGIPPGQDLDMDGMDDLWEFENGLDFTVNDSLLDSDGDGFTNIEESAAGTFPRDGSSFLKIVSVTKGATSTAILWESIFGINYTIQRSTTLAPNDWITVGTTTGMDCFTDFDIPLSSSSAVLEFYRVIATNPNSP